MGELKKLGIHSLSRNTVKNILKEHGLDPAPQRAESTWHEFVARHAATLWQCDFFSAKVVTLTGWKHFFVMAFLHVGTRRVFVSPATAHPDEAWVRTQAAAFVEHAKSTGLPAEILFHDRDSKFTAAFDADLKAVGLDVRLAPPRSPNTQAFIERWILSVKQECLDHFLILGEKHLNYLADEFAAHYNVERPHQARDNEPLIAFPFPDSAEGKIVCQKRLGHRWLGNAWRSGREGHPRGPDGDFGNSLTRWRLGPVSGLVTQVCRVFRRLPRNSVKNHIFAQEGHRP